MKNPLEFTLLEVDALLHGDEREPHELAAQHKALAEIVLYVRERQREMHDYAVAKVTQQIQKKENEVIPRRKARSLDQELLDTCEVVNVDVTLGESA